MTYSPPAVLCLSGHDPSGGAGLHADIEALHNNGCHACSVITTLTLQDTRNIEKIFPQCPEMIVRQINLLLADIDIRALKIGLVGAWPP